MPIELKQRVALLRGQCHIEEAETLLAWLSCRPQAKVNLKHVEHLHCAILQVLMAVKPEVSVWPVDEGLAAWLAPALADDQLAGAQLAGAQPAGVQPAGVQPCQ